MEDRHIITQKEMSEMSGVDVPLISKYLNNVKTPMLTTAKRICDDCNLPLDIFLKVETQKYFFGKSFLKQDVDYRARPRQIEMRERMKRVKNEK
jgi:transcriptional regulator with XRE-family HTH domain